MRASQQITAADLWAYYRAVAPFYEREMRLRSDLDEWAALARRVGARRVLDLGSGSGRTGRAIQGAVPGALVVGLDLTDALLDGSPRPPLALGDMRALPFASGAFDLVAAANDPFAHLLEDGDRVAAVRQALGACAPGGRVVVDGLWLSTHDRRLASGGQLVRERDLGGGLILREHWRARTETVFDTRYEYRERGAVIGDARARVRTWEPRGAAVRECDGRVHGSLDERAFLPSGGRIVVIFEAPR